MNDDARLEAILSIAREFTAIDESFAVDAFLFALKYREARRKKRFEEIADIPCGFCVRGGQFISMRERPAADCPIAHEHRPKDGAPYRPRRWTPGDVREQVLSWCEGLPGLRSVVVADEGRAVVIRVELRSATIVRLGDDMVHVLGLTRTSFPGVRLRIEGGDCGGGGMVQGVP